MPDPKLTRIAPADLPDDLRGAHDKSMQLRSDATFFEVFGNHPALYRWYVNSFYAEVFHGGLVARRIKELVRLRLSTTHGCRFCKQGNREDARQAGLSDQEIDQVGSDDLSSFSAAERAALKLADQLALTNPQGTLDDALYADLRAHFSDAEVLELGMVAGILSGIAKFLFVFDLVEKEANCPFDTREPVDLRR